MFEKGELWWMLTTPWPTLELIYLLGNDELQLEVYINLERNKNYSCYTLLLINEKMKRLAYFR